jgi:uncharacterized membrane protein
MGPASYPARLMSQLFAVVSSAFYGFADLSGGLATRRMALWGVMAWSQTLGLGLLAVGVVVVGTDVVAVSDVAYGALGGVFGVIGLAILYSTLAAGTMSVVAPITGAIAAVVPVAVDLITGSRPGPRALTGIGMALVAVLVIGMAGRAHGLSKAILGRAFLAGVSFGVFFIAFSQTSEESGLWPLVVARLATIPVLALIAVVTGTMVRPRGRDLRLLVIAGNLDMGANVFLSLALQRGPLAVNAVLVSLYPAFTVLAAVVVLKERPVRMQWLGIALAVISAALLAL